VGGGPEAALDRLRHRRRKGIDKQGAPALRQPLPPTAPAAPSFTASEFPPIETPLIDGEVAFRQHSGGHTSGPNWPVFLEFASRYLRALAPR